MLQVAAVVALKSPQPTRIKTEQPIHGAIQKPAVVGDDHHATLKILKKVLQHRQGGHIQIVGRFIQQQHIGGADQQPTQMQPAPLPAGEPGHRLVLLGRREQKAFQQLGSTELHPIHLDPACLFLNHIDHLALAPPPSIDGLQGGTVLIEIGQPHGGTEFQPSRSGG